MASPEIRRLIRLLNRVPLSQEAYRWELLLLLRKYINQAEMEKQPSEGVKLLAKRESA